MPKSSTITVAELAPIWIAEVTPDLASGTIKQYESLFVFETRRCA